MGPWPTEVESALLLTQAAYTKAQCLSWDIEDQGLLRLGLQDLFNMSKSSPQSGYRMQLALQLCIYRTCFVTDSRYAPSETLPLR